nr:hypothetical protein [Burkholderia cepacia]
MTFREATEAFIRVHEPQWRNPKHVQQWSNTLKTYAYPVIGGVRARYRHGDDRADPSADLDKMGGDGAACARPHQSDPRRRDGKRLGMAVPRC